MNNEFYVDPASPLEGIKNLGESLTKRVDFERKKAEKKKQEDAFKEGLQLMQDGTPEEIRTFMSKNPAVIDALAKAEEMITGMKKEEALQNYIDIITGEIPPAQPSLSKAKQQIESGQDATGNLKIAEEAQKNPEQAKINALKGIALYGTKDQFDNLSKLYGIGTTGSIEASKTRATRTFVNGTMVQSTDLGPRVYDPTGKRVTGDRAKKVLEKAMQDEIEYEGGKAGSRTQASLDIRKEIEPIIEALKTQKKGEETRAGDLIERGILAAESTATLRRGIELLDRLKTGGVAAVKYHAHT